MDNSQIGGYCSNKPKILKLKISEWIFPLAFLVQFHPAGRAGEGIIDDGDIAVFKLAELYHALDGLLLVTGGVGT